MENSFHISEDRQVEVLINQMESCPDQFKQLQIFLRREGNDCKSDCEFLMVSPTVFGKVKILNLNVEDHYVVLEFIDCITKQVGNVRININDETPQFLFISWQDVRKMVFEESTKHNNDELLELEY